MLNPVDQAAGSPTGGGSNDERNPMVVRNDPLERGGDAMKLGWALAWLGVGAGFVLSVVAMFTIGPLVLAPTVLATIALARRPDARASAPALIAGGALPCFYVAYLNRAGPGEVCSVSAAGSSCTQELNPWGFVMVGSIFVTGAVLVTLLLRLRRSVKG